MKIYQISRRSLPNQCFQAEMIFTMHNRFVADRDELPFVLGDFIRVVGAINGEEALINTRDIADIMIIEKDI